MLINKSMRVIRYHQGIKLVPEKAHLTDSSQTIDYLFQLPFSVYFLDLDGKTILINEEGAKICGFSSSKQAIGKSLLDVSKKENASLLMNNCYDVMHTQKRKIFDESNLRQDGVSMQFLSVKIPWYDTNNLIVGILGASIVVGKHSLSQSLSLLTELGLFNQDSANEININDVKLSEREMQCLQFTVKGYTAKKIAKELNISHRTIEEYLNNIRIKVGVNSKSELIEMTMQNFFVR
jgi:DNA-binding CsgD family transcriptional regulator